MRYVVYNVSVDYIVAIGGTNVKAAKSMAMVFADLTDAQVAQIKSDGFQVVVVQGVSTGNTVATPDVTPIIPIPGISVYSPSQLFDYIGLTSLRTITNPPLYGKNLNVAVIDTGIRETHQKINGHIVYSRNFTSDVMQDGYDHGTAVAGIIAELAPEAGILNMKVLNDSGYGTEEEVALAIDACIDLIDTNPNIAPSIINLSAGTPDLNEPNAPLRLACRQAMTAGIIVCAAAGNGGPIPNSVMSPACEQYVIAVGSCNVDTHEVSDFSSRGPTLGGLVKPDIVLFGENVVVASSSSDSSVVSKSGTSFSAPIATVMALLAQEGIIRQVEYSGGVPLGFRPSALPGTLTDVALLDRWIPRITVKPAGSPTTKDNNLGYGLPFGTLISQTIESLSGFDISALIPAMLVIGMIGMMANMMNSVSTPKKRLTPTYAT